MSLRLRLVLPIIIITVIQAFLKGIDIPFLILLGGRVVYISRYYLFQCEVRKTVITEVVAIVISIFIPIALAYLPPIKPFIIWIALSGIVIALEQWSDKNIVFIEEEFIDENE